MRKVTLSLAFAASAVAMAAIQANGTSTSPPGVIADRGARACKALVQKMERSAAADTWRNRIRTWKCRDDLSVDKSQLEAVRELDQ
jgi:hypothetical protein